MLRGGIIGFGKVGQAMTRLIREKFAFADIVAACNRSREKLDIAKADYGIDRVTHDAEELCSWDLDFVMVLSSNSAHRAHVEAAARHGRAVFCEKPIATTLEDAEAMVAAVEKAGVLTHVNYMLRFLPAYRELARLCSDGALGRLLSVQALRFRGFGLHGNGMRHWAVEKPEESGGWIVHHACHGIDLAYWLGGKFTQVYAQMQTTLPGSPELVWGMGRLEGGATAVVADSVCGSREHEAVVVGTRGQAFLSGETDTTLRVVWEPRDGGKSVTERIPVESKGYPAFFEDSLREFFATLRSGSESKVSLSEAVHSLAVARAMVESARAGHVVNV